MADDAAPGVPQAVTQRISERIAVESQLRRLGVDAVVTDVSEDGAFVHSASLLPVGARARLRFTLMVEDPLVVDAEVEVVRHQVSPKGMGVRFTSIAPDHVLRIADMVARGRGFAPRAVAEETSARLQAHAEAAERAARDQARDQARNEFGAGGGFHIPKLLDEPPS